MYPMSWEIWDQSNGIYSFWTSIKNLQNYFYKFCEIKKKFQVINKYHMVQCDHVIWGILTSQTMDWFKVVLIGLLMPYPEAGAMSQRADHKIYDLVLPFSRSSLAFLHNTVSYMVITWCPSINVQLHN